MLRFGIDPEIELLDKFSVLKDVKLENSPIPVRLFEFALKILNFVN